MSKSSYENLVNKINRAIYNYFDSPSMSGYEIAFPITSVICSLVADALPDDIAKLVREGIRDFIRTAEADIRGEETDEYDDWNYSKYFHKHAQSIRWDTDEDEE